MKNNFIAVAQLIQTYSNEKAHDAELCDRHLLELLVFLYWIQWKAQNSLQCHTYRDELNCNLVWKMSNKFQANYNMGRIATNLTWLSYWIRELQRNV